MERMGYGEQPYLVYRHEDTKHPHLHIVSVNVDSSGQKVDTDLYKLKSEKTRKELEIEFGLVRAEGREQKLEAIQRVAPDVVKYGVSETK
jgi:type IV secretory pathway VirD2 relaxase